MLTNERLRPSLPRFLALLLLCLPIVLGACRRSAETAVNSPGAAAGRKPLNVGPPSGKGGAPEGGPRGAGEGKAVHPEELHLPPPPARQLFVSNRAPSEGDGTEARPWKDLQSALRKLQPGDRLVILPGNYAGSWAIDASCAAGSKEQPIEVHAKVNAVLKPDGNLPPLRVSQKGWTLIGLEIVPGKSTGPALEIAGAQDLLISHAHLHDGRGDGVRIEPGSERITIEKSHIHIFGARGGPAARRAEVTGLRIAPGTRDVVVRSSKIHNIAGPPVKVLTPEEYGAPGTPRLAAATGINLEGLEQEANWPEAD